MNADDAASLDPRPWTARRQWTIFILILAAHAVLLVVFSDKKSRPVRPVTGVPTLRLAPANDEYIALSDPTLFALPHAHDFVTPVWTQPRTNTPPAFQWTADPSWLPLPAAQLGKAFGRFMDTNQFAAWTPDFKPEPKFSSPALSLDWALPQRSALHLRGELAQRPLLTPLILPDWPDADVIAPSKVQVLVNAAGQVISAVLLAPDYGYETATHDPGADLQAVVLARGARFGSAPGITVGQMIFMWHTVPPAAAPAGGPPKKT
jgi:hypothetical protein